MATHDDPDSKPSAGIPLPLALATPATMGYQAPAAPVCRQVDMTDDEIEVAFAALWRKLDRCDD